MDAVYLDFQKAVDKVSHSKLLSKMDRYGIDKGVVRWVRNWLSGRRQSDDRWSNVWSGVGVEWCSSGVCVGASDVHCVY